METIRTEIIVRFAGRARRYLFSGARIAFGSGQGCSWRVQQPWLADEHVVLENAGQCARVRIGHPGAVAMVEGNRLTPQWTLMASEGTIHIPATQGRTLEIEFSCDQRRCDVLNHERLVSSPEDAGELGVQFVSTDAVADESRGGGGSAKGLARHRPQAGPDAAGLRALKVNELPELSGAVPASKKGECEVLLLGEKANVLAARFQCGRGRVFAFTSDAKADWAKLWVEWPGYSTFWSQALEDVLRPPQAYRVTSRRFERSGKVLFVFYVQHEDGTPAEELMGSGSFAAEERGSSTQPVARAGVSDPAIQCSQKVAGEYHFSIDVPPVGHARLALLSLSNSLSPVVNYAAMVSAGMTEEMAATGPDLAAAAAIAEVGNGIVVDDPARVGRAVPKPYEMIVEADRPLWRYLLIAALALWPIDVLVRKVM